MKRADKNIVINVNNVGIDNKVEVNVNVNKSPIKTPDAVVIALSVIAGDSLDESIVSMESVTPDPSAVPKCLLMLSVLSST